MPLDAIVTDISTIPEALQGEYLEKDGKFFLQVKPVDGWDLQDISGLTKTMQAERALKNQLEKALAPFKGIDPDTARTAITQVGEFEGLTPAEARTLKAELDGLKKLDPKAKADEIAQAKIDAAKSEWERALGTKRTEWQTALDGAKANEAALRTQLKTLLVDNDVKTELGKVKLVSGVQPAAEMLLNRQIQVVEKDGGIERVVIDVAGNPRTKLEGTTLVPVTIADLVAELKENMPALFQADAPSGTGIPVGTAPPVAPGVKNPWSKEHLNRTEQVLLKKKDPALAAKLMAAAGAVV